MHKIFFNITDFLLLSLIYIEPEPKKVYIRDLNDNLS